MLVVKANVVLVRTKEFGENNLFAYVVPILCLSNWFCCSNYVFPLSPPCVWKFDLEAFVKEKK